MQIWYASFATRNLLPIFLTLFLANCPPETQQITHTSAGQRVSSQIKPSLDSFKLEAETALGRSIQYVDEDTGVHLGETYCDMNPVLIRRRAGLPDNLRLAVTAHELGHAILCARGIKTVYELTAFGRGLDTHGVVSGLAAEVGSCYIDPLADAEGKHRGFDITPAVDEFFRAVSSHPAESFSAFVEEVGDIGTRYYAAAIYCTGLREHGFKLDNLEGRFGSIPAVKSRLEEFRRVLGSPTCTNADTCFQLTKRLRDETGLRGFMSLQNPTTNGLE